MTKVMERSLHALFRSIDDDGTTWQFVIERDTKWSITRDGVHVDFGAADRVGIDTGVRKFLQLAGSGTPKLAATRKTLATHVKGK